MKFTADRKAVALGAIAGMRSAAAVAVASRCMVKNGRFRKTRWALLASPTASALFTAMAVAELVADKFTHTERTAPAPLTARIASGALSGAAMCAADGKAAGRGATLGALAAVAGAWGFNRLRKRLASGAGIPQQLVGLAEDAVVLRLGKKLLRH